ncbi:efflux RND transporter permease subunit, partial [Staphylococcus aureus]|uniref:efflux RND transporter permease subunit n=1 Tax=Staphylococcus aureus TaxID=1280 RepID=UPI003A8023BC
PYRQAPEDIRHFFVRGPDGQMSPYSAFSTLEWRQAPVQLTRYNGQAAMQIQGSAAPGVSSGDALAAMEEMAAKLPPGT